MRILFVTGGDYAAVAVENIGIERAAKTVEAGGQLGEEEDEIEAEIFEFGEIDEHFLQFIQDHMIDYDSAKTTNFYVLNDKKKRKSK